MKIDIHDQLYKWRQVIVKEGYVSPVKAMGMKAMVFTFAHPKFFAFAGKAGRAFMKYFPFVVSNKLNPWYKEREMPAPPKESFREWYAKNITKS